MMPRRVAFDRAAELIACSVSDLPHLIELFDAARALRRRRRGEVGGEMQLGPEMWKTRRVW
jgi:hypothetical protein